MIKVTAPVIFFPALGSLSLGTCRYSVVYLVNSYSMYLLYNNFVMSKISSKSAIECIKQFFKDFSRNLSSVDRYIYTYMLEFSDARKIP